MSGDLVRLRHFQAVRLLWRDPNDGMYDIVGEFTDQMVGLCLGPTITNSEATMALILAHNMLGWLYTDHLVAV